MKKLALLILCLFIALLCEGQVIKGRVFIHGTDHVIANASIYYDGMFKGTSTNSEGYFEIPKLNSKVPLIVSAIGYYSSTIVNADQAGIIQVFLKPQVYALQEVVVNFDDGMSRESKEAIFKKEFLGTSTFARSAKIVNLDDVSLTYDKKTETLRAFSKKPIVIKNEALGYTLNYSLEKFTRNPQNLSVKGNYYFAENVLSSAAETKKVAKNRKYAYEGSRMEFIRSLIAGSLTQKGYKVYRKDWKVLDIDSLVKIRGDSTKNLLMQDDIIIVYMNNRNHNTLIKRKDIVLIGADGYFDPDGFSWKGPIANQRIGDLLPYTYQDSESKNEPLARASSNSGKNTNNLIASALDTIQLSSSDKPINKIAGDLLKWSSEHSVEKVHLHTDKSSYYLGDTIWFKAYVTTADRYLSKVSGVLYVELINDLNSSNSVIKLPIAAGTSSGDFVLSDSLTAGNYRIRAYTNWMQNAGEEYFFDRIIPVMDARQITATPASSTNLEPGLKNNIDLQFFPEGGDLVYGISSKVAFKAVAENGQGVILKGIVLDSENVKVAEVITKHFGMGSFTLLPERGKRYRATISYPNGEEKTIELPIPKDKGFVLAINNDDAEELGIEITVNPALFPEVQNTAIYLVAQSGGKISYAAKNKIASPTITARVPKAMFPSGIVQFTLFSHNGEPLNERLVFIQNPDPLNLIINTEKAVYKPGEQISINLTAENSDSQPVIGSFSISAVNQDRVSYDEINEHTIFSDLFLTSDIKGYIEKPNYYFTNITDHSRSNLDLLMLTQGYRRFEWKQLLSGNFPSLNYKAEKGISISGNVKSLLGKPIDNGNVTLISPNGGLFEQIKTDEIGKFKFENLNFSDTSKIMIQAQTKSGNRNVIIKIDDSSPLLRNLKLNSFKTDTNSTDFLPNYTEIKRNEFAERSMNDILIPEVIVKAKKVVQNHSSNIAGIGSADVVITSDIIMKGGGTLRQRLIASGKLGRSTQHLDSMRLIINGVYMASTFSIDNVNPSDVSSIEILRNAGALGIYGVSAGGPRGILIINFKRGDEYRVNSTESYVPGLVTLTNKGFYQARNFYIPKHVALQENSSNHDFRSTILWQPHIVTDSNGRGTINTFSTKTPGNYRVIVEGMDTERNIGRQVFHFMVKE